MVLRCTTSIQQSNIYEVVQIRDGSCHNHMHLSPSSLNWTCGPLNWTCLVHLLQFRPLCMMSFVSILMSCAPIPLLFLILCRYLPLVSCVHWPHLFTWTLHLPYSHLLGTLASHFHPLDVPVGSGADHMPWLSHLLWLQRPLFPFQFGVWSGAGYTTLTGVRC